MKGTPSPDELRVRRARRQEREFLEGLRDRPFVTIMVLEDGSIRLYTKGIAGVPIDDLRSALNELAG